MLEFKSMRQTKNRKTNLKNLVQKETEKGLWQIRKFLVLSYRFCLKRPKTLFGFFLVTSLLGAILASQLKTLLLIDEMIDADFQTYSELQQLNRDFSEKNNAILILRPKSNEDIISKRALCDLRQWVSSLYEREDIIEIKSSFGVKKPVFTSGKLDFESLFEIDCGRRSDPEFEKIKSSLAAVKQSPWGAGLTSLNSNDVVVQFAFRETIEDTRLLHRNSEKAFASNTVLNLKRDFETEVEKKNEDIKSVWSGIATFQGFYQKAYDNMALLNILSFVLILLLMRFLFGTFKSGLLFLLSYMAAVLPVFGGMALFDVPIDVLSNSLPFMLLIATMEDFLFVCLFLQAKRRPWRASFRKFLLPCFFTTLTTAVGFASLVISDLAIIKRFGAFAAIGSLFEFITVFYFLPALLQLFPKLQNWVTKPAPSWHWIERLKSFRIKRWVGFASLALFLLAFLRMDRIVVSDAPTNIFPYSHYANLSTQELLNTRAWQTTLSLVLNEPQNAKFNKDVINELKKQNGVIAIEDPYEIEDYLKQDVPQLYSATVQQLWTFTSTYLRLNNPDSHSARAIVYIAHQDIENTNRLYHWTKNRCEGKCFLAGSLVSYSEFGSRVLSTLLDSFLVSLLIVGAILVFLCMAKKVDSIFSLVASALWGPLAIIFLFVALKIPVFYITSMFASILVGLAGDNSIQFIFSKSKGSVLNGVSSIGSSSVLVVFSMILMTTPLLFSDFAALQKLAVLMSIGFLFMLIGDISILKSLHKPEKSIHESKSL